MILIPLISPNSRENTGNTLAAGREKERERVSGTSEESWSSGDVGGHPFQALLQSGRETFIPPLLAKQQPNEQAPLCICRDRETPNGCKSSHDSAKSSNRIDKLLNGLALPCLSCSCGNTYRQRFKYFQNVIARSHTIVVI